MKKSAVATLALFTFSISLYAQFSLQPIAEVKMSARVPITLGQLKTRVTALEREIGRKMTFEERKQTLDGLINEYLIVQAAEKEGLKIMDSEVNTYFNEYVSNQLGKKITEAEFEKIIKEQANMSLDAYMKSQNGMTLAEFKNFLKTQLTAQAYVMQKKRQELAALPLPTDSQIRSYYEVNKQSFVQPDTVQLFLVVVPKGTNASAAEKKINELQKQLEANPKNTATIRTNAHEKNADYDAGEVFISKTALAAQQLGVSMEELLKIFTMKKGEVSSVNETPANYQCFVLLDKKEAKILMLSDTVQPGSNVSLYEYIKQMVTMQQRNEALNNALVTVTNELRKPENFTILKTASELEKTLSW